MESEATSGKTFIVEREEKLNDAVKDFFIAGDCDGILELIKKEKIYSFCVQPFTSNEVKKFSSYGVKIKKGVIFWKNGVVKVILYVELKRIIITSKLIVSSRGKIEDNRLQKLAEFIQEAVNEIEKEL